MPSLFPQPHEAVDDILAIGGQLNSTTLFEAYSIGAFPWYMAGEPPIWYHPDPRFVLFPGELRISKSLRQFLRNTSLSFTLNQDFAGVISGCRHTARNYAPQTPSWIHDDVEKAFLDFHQKGFAISGEAWHNGQLVGGLYGVLLGKVFFGESMFTRVSNASKFAFVTLIETLKTERQIVLIDCQTHSAHLESLGARFISRDWFCRLLQRFAH